MIRRIASAAAVLAGCIAVLVLVGAGGSQQGGVTLRIAFDNAFGLTSGGDLRVAGTRAGQTSGFDVSKGPECQLGQNGTNPPRTCAVVEAQVTRSGFQSFRSDATCSIRQQSLIGEYYVDCQPGTSQTLLSSLPSKGNSCPRKNLICDSRTASTIPSDLVQDIARQPYRDRFRLILGELGTGLAGRPQDIALLLHRAAPALQETDRVLSILANQHQIVQNFITNSNTVIRELDANKQDVGRWIQEAGRTAQISATRAQAIAQGWHKLPAFLSGLQQNSADLGGLIDAQTPMLRELSAAAPSLNTFFTEIGPYSQANIPNIRTLGQASVIGKKAFRDFNPDLRQLDLLAQDAPHVGKPLRQFLQTFDNRGRSVEADPRAGQSAPPAPDPTAYHSGQGFTGMESLLNYFYWQTLDLNQFDPIGHILDVLVLIDPVCGTWQTGGTLQNPDTRARCNVWEGPYQPGITAPDPSKSSTTGTIPQPGPTQSTVQRGQPAATTPAPGQPDYSRPNPTIPPSAQQLLQSLGVRAPSAPRTNLPSAPSLPQAPSVPSTGAQNAPSSSTVNNALDYLLGP